MGTIFSEVQIYLIFTQATIRQVHLLHLPHSKDTLGVMSLQHVLVTYHYICTGQEISC